MSYSTLHVVEPNGDVVDDGEYQNGHGYAMPIWSYLAEKYLRKPGEADTEFFGRWWLKDQCKGVWELEFDPRLERFERVVLIASFDRVVVKKENFQELSDAFSKFGALYREKEPNNVNHYVVMGSVIKEMMKDDVTGVCWTATSCGDDIWTVNEECECPTCGTSHTKDDPRPYNIKKDKSHFFLFERLDLLAKQEGKPA